MNTILSICLMLCLSLKVFSQHSRKIQVTPYYRYDNYPSFTYRLGDRPSIDDLKMQGQSFGIDIDYVIPAQRELFFKVGLGYYRYAFNNIEKNNTQFGKAEAREITTNSIVFIQFATDRYYYHNLSANLAAGKMFPISSSLTFAGSIGIKNYITFSRNYHLVHNPIGSSNFRKRELSYFGSSGYMEIGLSQSIGKISIGPTVFVPVFDTWKTDPSFPNELNTTMRIKWFRGIGAGISCSFSL